MSNVFNEQHTINVQPPPLPIKGVRKEVVNHYRVQYTFGDFILNSTRVLFHKDRQINVSPKELGVLILLLESAGEVVSKDRIINEVWYGGNVSEESLTRCIYVLRRILQEGKNNRFIDTVYGKGYRFALPVTRVTPRESVVAANCVFAVFPFQLASNLNMLDLHDGLVQQMTKYVPLGLHVLPSSLTLGCKTPHSVLELMEKIRPDYYLSGYQLTQADGPFLRVELMRAQDHLVLHREAISLKEPLTSESVYHRIKPFLLKNIPCLQQGERKVKHSLSASELQALKSESTHAFLDYTPQSLARALDLLKQGHQQFPSDIALMFNLAECYFALGQLGIMELARALRKSGALINTLLKQAPDHPDALALGGAMHGLNADLGQAADMFSRALKLSKENALVNYYYAWHLFIVGETDRALYFARQAQKIRPEMVSVKILSLWLEYCSGNPQAALDIRHKHSSHPHPVLISFQAVVLCGEGQHGSAAELIQPLLAGSEQDGIVFFNALYANTFSPSATANREHMDKLMSRSSLVMPSAWLPVILQCHGFGAARKWFDELLAASSPCLTLWRHDPRLKPLFAAHGGI